MYDITDLLGFLHGTDAASYITMTDRTDEELLTAALTALPRPAPVPYVDSEFVQMLWGQVGQTEVDWNEKLGETIRPGKAR